MTFSYLISPPLTVVWALCFTLLVLFTAWKRKKKLRLVRAPKQAFRQIHWALVRHLLMIAMMVIIAFTPQIATESSTKVSATEIYLLVDTTGSMGALDYHGQGVSQAGLKEDGTPLAPTYQKGQQPRYDGVRKDIHELIDKAGPVRFCVITTADKGVIEIPLTTDNHAVETWIDYGNVEDPSQSAGSSLERGYKNLLNVLRHSYKAQRDATRLLFVFSDGEETVDPHTLKKPADWASLAQFIKGGAVFQYGTQEGAKMPYHAHFLSDDSASLPQFIEDPETGKPAISRADPKNLQKIAEELQIEFFDQNDGASLDRVLSQHGEDGKNLLSERPVIEYRDFILPFVGILVILVGCEAGSYLRFYERMRRDHVIGKH
ncbi:MAG: vWA domain-containing protein [Actinomycetaceae bacterium]|nr:vWA domain-containing protein [Actinomycetaceae bacterium]